MPLCQEETTLIATFSHSVMDIIAPSSDPFPLRQSWWIDCHRISDSILSSGMLCLGEERDFFLKSHLIMFAFRTWNQMDGLDGKTFRDF